MNDISWLVTDDDVKRLLDWVTGAIRDCHFQSEVGYLPPFFRRRRLRRWRSLVRDVRTTRALWKWLHD